MTDAVMAALYELIVNDVPEGWARCEYCYELMSAEKGGHDPNCPLLQP